MYKVIIADDEPKVSQLIKNLIDWEALGLEHTATAQDGIAALELIGKHQPEIVITDIRMPGYDGIELIKYAKEINPKIDFIIISGYQHFDYAHNAIKYGVKDYLLKPLNKNEINTALSKMVEKYSERSRQEMHLQDDIKRLRNELLRNIYLGYGDPVQRAADLKQINQDYNSGFVEGCYQATIIKPDFEYQPNNHEAVKMLLLKASKVVEQNLKGVCTELLQLLLEDRIFIIANYTAENKKVFRKVLNNIIEGCHLFRDIFKDLTVTVGLGSAQTSLAGMVQSACEAKEALDDRIILGSGKIVQYNPELHMKKSVEAAVNFEKRRKLLGMIEIFDAAGIEKWIDENEAEVLKLQNISGQFVLAVIEDILETLLFGLKNNAKANTVDNSLIVEFHEALLMQTSVRAVFDVLNRYVGIILRQIAEDRKNESSRPIKEAQKYINEHYASAVNLEEVSNLIGFNATYLSTLFKKETGMNFVEYVTNVRIKSAKQLLSDSKRNILDISHEVGYSDFKHFTKQFKKVTGLTPSEYRKLYY
ncbi:MAG TPA: response regulator [Clostridia bacterium]|nr:response regulator [Clostridia bacterium]